MSAIALAITGAVLGTGATIFASTQASKSAKAANAANLANAQSDRELQAKIFEQSRGSEGFAKLPLFATRDGQPLEPELFGDALAVYDIINRLSPEEQKALYQGAFDRFTPAATDAGGVVADLMSGELEQRSLEDLQPVAEARLGAAETRKQAGKEALAETLARIEAIQRGRGFTGDSFNKNLLSFRANRDINQTSASEQALAKLENEQDALAVKREADRLRLGNVTLPSNLRRIALEDADAVNDALVKRFNQSAGVFRPFDIGTGSYQFTPMPRVEPVPGLGQNIAEGVAGLAGTGLNYGMNYLLAQQLAPKPAIGTSNLPVGVAAPSQLTPIPAGHFPQPEG